MTPRTRTEFRPTPLRSPQRAVGLFLAAAVLAVLIVAPSLSTAAFVPRLTIDNPTAFDVNVELASGADDGVALGTIGREGQSVLEEVADPGGQWTFRFSYAGVDGGDLVLSRADLRSAGWQLVVPAEVGERLLAAGVVASAR